MVCCVLCVEGCVFVCSRVVFTLTCVCVCVCVVIAQPLRKDVEKELEVKAATVMQLYVCCLCGVLCVL